MELLAPAGGMAALQAAVENGADAVYLAGSDFGARKHAVNFSDDELVRGIQYAHLRGAKVHVTLNTLLHDGELQRMLDFAAFCANAGADAFIVQDAGAAALLREHVPQVPLHASTQMTIDCLAGVRQAQKLGFSRVVLARELTAAQIAYICAHTDMETEVFVHGALCVSYSGQCLLSSLLGGCSGNRGACRQPCRLPYTVLDGAGRAAGPGKRYWLSPKDQCLVGDMAELEKMGVTSLKIEGRMKGPAYVGTVTRIYDKYRHGGRVEDADRRALEEAFSRGGTFSRGYFGGDRGRAFLCYETHNDHLHGGAAAGPLANTRKVPVFGRVEIAVGRPLALELWDGAGHRALAYGEIAEPARTLPLSEGRVREQLGKLGGTPFVLEGLEIRLEEAASLPMRALNAVRREAAGQLCSQRTAVGRPPVQPPRIALPHTRYGGPMQGTAEVCTAAQARQLAGRGFARLYVPYAVWADCPDLQELPEVWVKLPAVAWDGVEPGRLAGRRVELSSLSQLEISCGMRHAGYAMNTFNSASMREWAHLGLGSVCLSPELTLAEVCGISKEIPAEAVIYGRLPVMTTRHCPWKAAAGRCGCGGFYVLRDRKGMEFPVLPEKGRCVSVIYNAAPLYMADRMQELAGAGLAYGRFLFTVETAAELEAVLEDYRTARKRAGGYTRGHYYRGV